nr:hypothetical protein [Myxococcota bacterium]
MLASLLASLASCESGSAPESTIDRCLARRGMLVVGAEPLVLTLGPSRTPGTCERGDIDPDAVLQLDALRGADLLVRAVPDDPSVDLILAMHRVCGDPVTLSACADHGPGPTGAEALVIDSFSGISSFVSVRTRSGRPATVTISARERPRRRDGDACDPAGGAPGCADDPECMPLD